MKTQTLKQLISSISHATQSPSFAEFDVHQERNRTTFVQHSRAVSELELLTSKLELVNSPLSSDEIQRLLILLHMNESEMAKYFRPSSHQYHRESVFRTSFVELIAITWLPGQASSIHDHNQSACGVLVLTGKATETLFEQVSSDEAIPIRTSVVETGKVFGGESPSSVHIIANQDTTLLRTLHFYSPPLTRMKTFRNRVNHAVSLPH